jgi:hypothetical protein
MVAHGELLRADVLPMSSDRVGEAMASRRSILVNIRHAFQGTMGEPSGFWWAPIAGRFVGTGDSWRHGLPVPSAARYAPPHRYPGTVELSRHGWRGRRQSSGFLGGFVLLLGALAALVVLAVLAALGLLLMAVVGAVMLAERLLALLVPAYGRRRRERYLTMPVGLIRMVRFGSGPGQVIEAHSYELPHGATKS